MRQPNWPSAQLMGARRLLCAYLVLRSKFVDIIYHFFGLFTNESKLKLSRKSHMYIKMILSICVHVWQCLHSIMRQPLIQTNHFDFRIRFAGNTINSEYVQTLLLLAQKKFIYTHESCGVI